MNGVCCAPSQVRNSSEVAGEPQVVCATGFLRGFRYDPLLSRLVEEHALDTYDRWIVLAPDCTVPSLTDARRTLAVAGAAPFLPADPVQRAALLDLFLLDKALYELNYELNSRPDWTRIPLRGLAELLG